VGLRGSSEFVGWRQADQNAFIESFNGRLRDECLNTNWFATHAARAAVAQWQHHYNFERPHAPLGRIPPSIFASTHTPE